MVGSTPLSAEDRAAVEDCKYRYLRAVDTKDWDLLASTLTEDAVARYGGGVHTVEGRDEIVDFLRSRLESDGIHTSHRVSHPELAVDDEGRVTGRWALDDVVIDPTMRFQLTGAAWYLDTYVRQDDGSWRIAETGYTRTYELVQQLPEGATMTASAWTTGGKTTLPY